MLLEELTVSTEKLRCRLLQEGVNEDIVKDCESIVQSEFSELQNQFLALQRKHVLLLDTLRQLEVLWVHTVLAESLFKWPTYFFMMQTEKVELETTVVDETKERESYIGQVTGRLSGKK